jgi:hypothetical protein
MFSNFDKWIREIPVIGFHSGKYDGNIMETYLYDMLFKYDNKNQNIQALKTGNCYLVITSNHFMFLDVSQFLAAGTSLDEWLKLINVRFKKLFFLMNG